MTERTKHRFQFPADQIAKAAEAEATYHAGRVAYWQDELEKSWKIVADTAFVKVTKHQHTGGWSPSVVVDYGDPDAYQRMGQAGAKIQSHEQARDRYKSDADVYATQESRVYDLDLEDVSHFRLNGAKREE